MTPDPHVFGTFEEAQAAVEYAELKKRVTALEMAADIASFPSSWQELTEAEQAGFIAAIAESRQRVSHRILNAPLTPDEVRQLLRECVTVVKPGETLAVRVPMSTPPHVVRELQEMADHEQQAGMPFPVLIVVGEGMAVVTPEKVTDEA